VRWRWVRIPIQDRRNLAILAAVAGAIRLVLILAYSPVLTSDSYSYLDLAHRLASLHLHGSSGARTPGYPLVLLALGYSPVATWCLQAVIGTVASLLVYGLVRRLGGGTRIALAAGLLYALDLEVLAVEHLILTETLTSFLLLVAAHIAVSIVEAGRARRRALAAVSAVLAYLCLVRPDSVAVTVYLAVALVTALAAGDPARSSVRAAAVRAAWILVLPAAIAAGWIGVNRASVGVTSLSSVLGYNMIDHVAAYVQPEHGRNYAITTAYVAARRHRQAQTSDLANVSADAQPAMERASGLDAAHLSGRLLSIALAVIERHPVQYLGSSLRQWPQFWLPRNYAYEFANGRPSTALRLIWDLERALLALINLAFVSLVLVEFARRARRREPILSRPSLILAGIPLVGLIVATFFAYGETGRYGYVYFPLVLSVSFATAASVLQTVTAWAPRMRPRASRA
jgi:hypothetical protein